MLRHCRSSCMYYSFSNFYLDSSKIHSSGKIWSRKNGDCSYPKRVLFLSQRTRFPCQMDSPKLTLLAEPKTWISMSPQPPFKFSKLLPELRKVSCPPSEWSPLPLDLSRITVLLQFKEMTYIGFGFCWDLVVFICSSLTAHEAEDFLAGHLYYLPVSLLDCLFLLIWGGSFFILYIFLWFVINVYFQIVVSAFVIF